LEAELRPIDWNAQNSDGNLQMLRAQRVLYSQAKRYQLALLTFSVLYSVGAVATDSLWPGAGPIMGVGGGLLTLMMLFLPHSARTDRAARIQELFETSLFGLPWNELVSRPSPYEIAEASDQYRGTDTSLRDWFVSPPDGTSPSHAVAAKQMDNLTWDCRLRGSWATTLYCAWGFVFALGAVVGLIAHWTLDAYLVNGLLASLPGLQALILEAQGNRQLVELKAKLGTRMRELTAENRTAGRGVPAEQLRGLQDRILESRRAALFVPDWFNLWHRKRLQALMASAARVSGGGVPKSSSGPS
jgi:hypothetical protein